ncbi:MAG: hypothetical protein ACLQVM_27090 [Terriglobia bacterium]
MIKAFLNLCLILFLDMLAYMVAIVAAAAVAWAAVCGARWIFAAFRNSVMALRARQRKKEMSAHATR